MEGKEYPTRSKSGVRKTRTPWDNSSSLLFDELVGVKRSPKTPPTGVKGGESPSPRTSGKRGPGQSQTRTATKEKKVKSHMPQCRHHTFSCVGYSNGEEHSPLVSDFI